MTEECIREHAGIVDWFILAQSQTLSEMIIRDFQHEIPLHILAEYGRQRYYTLDFIREFRHQGFDKFYRFVWAANKIRFTWVRKRYAPSGWGYWRTIRDFESEFTSEIKAVPKIGLAQEKGIKHETHTSDERDERDERGERGERDGENGMIRTEKRLLGIATDIVYYVSALTKLYELRTDWTPWTPWTPW